MSSIVVAGDTSGSITLSAPAVAGSTVLTLPSVSGTVITTNSLVLQAGGIDEYNANTTLTSGNFGRLTTSNTATATTLTLPLASTGAIGSIMSFSNLNTGLLTITAAGSDIMLLNGTVLTTFTIPNGSSIQLAASGAGYWKALTGMTGGIGVNQTWQAVSRAIGTTYTNSTGKPITVVISYTNSIANTVQGLVIAGTTVYASGCQVLGLASGFSLVVPNGATYVTTTNGGTMTLVTSVELR